jgi:outer membrane protein
MKDLILLGGFLCLFLNSLWAQPKPLSLRESVRYAVQNSTKVQTALLDTDKNDWFVKEILSSALPQANFVGQFAYNYEIPVFLVPGAVVGQPDKDFVGARFGTNINNVVGGEISQLVFSKSLFLGLDAAKKARKLYELQSELTKDELAHSIAQLYYSVQVARKQRNTLRANLDQVSSLLNLTEKQYANGFAKKIDVDQLRVNRVNLENQSRNLDLQVELLEQSLKFHMAMPLDTPIALTDTIEESTYALPDIQALQPDFSQKKELAILDAQWELSELNVEQYRANYWPSLSAFANLNYQGAGNRYSDLQWFRFGAVGLNLRVPIFDGFQKKAQIQQARIEQLQLEQARRLANQGLSLAYKQAYQQLLTNLNNLRVLEQNRAMAEEVYRVAQSRFTEGVASIIEVLAAETAMREAQTNYLSALLQVKLAEVELLNAKGTLYATIMNAIQ